MGSLSLTLPNDGETIDASDVNGPFNSIASLLNGNLDDANINSFSGTKLTTGTLPLAAFTTADLTQLAQGWNTGANAPTSVTYSGNGSYSAIFSNADLRSLWSPGYRARFTRTTPVQTQSTSLNGTNQYWNKTSPAGMTFTDDFVVGAWIKLNSYGASGIIMSRYNGTSGWRLYVNSDGTIYLDGLNGSSANFSRVISAQSVPLGRWVHVAGQLDMSSFTASATTSYIMIDGVSVPVTVARGGTNPTALVQAGNLELGSQNSGTAFFPGKIAQAFVTSAKVTQANIQAMISQGITSSTISTLSIISAYSFDGSGDDLNGTNSNNLTAQGSATATNADSPFGIQADGTNSSTLEYALVHLVSYSAPNSTVVFQSPNGGSIPTSGGITSVSYAVVAVPYGFPKQTDKWKVRAIFKATNSVGSLLTQNTWYNPKSQQVIGPVGAWSAGYSALPYYYKASATIADIKLTLSNSTSTEWDAELTTRNSIEAATGTLDALSSVNIKKSIILTTATPLYLNVQTTTSGGVDDGGTVGAIQPTILYLENEYL